MRILVTGGSGFIGTNLLIKLMEEGSQVLSVDLAPPRIQVPHMELDVRSKDLKLAFQNLDPQFVIHLACLTSVEESIEFPEYYMSSIVEGTINCLRYCQPTSIFIYVSSQAAISSTSPYGAYKRLAEEICELRDNTAVVRPTNVYGEWSDRKDSVIARFMKMDELTIHGEGTQKRDFVYVQDVVEAIISLCVFQYNFRIENIASKNMVSINTIANLIDKPKINAPLPSSESLRTPEPVLQSLIPIPTSLRQGLTNTMKWFKEHYHAKRKT